MEIKKINTVPYGRVVIIVMYCEIILMLLLSIPLFPRKEAYGLIAFSAIFIPSIIDLTSKKYWNYIEVTKDYVCHNDKKHSWETVCITIKCNEPTFARNSYEYYVFFDDHYLTEEECNSKSVKKSGFFLILTMKRAIMLFQLYPKKINVLNESPYYRSNKITEYIRQHNLKYTDQ